MIPAPPLLLAPPFRLSVAFFLGILFSGVFGPFWPTWLAHRGMSPVEIGLLMSLLAWPRVITNPILGAFVDSRGYLRETLVGLSGVLLCLATAFFWAESFASFLVLTILLGCCIGGIGPLLDSAAMVLTRRRLVEYGRVRVWASISFITASVLTGRLVERHGPSLILPLLVGCIALGIAGFFAVPSLKRPSRASGSGSILSLFKDQGLALCFLTACLTQSSHAVFSAFSVLHWSGGGITGTQVGILWAAAVVGESAVFLMSPRIVARFGPARLMLAAALGAVVRWGVSGLTTDFALLLPTQALHGLSFALCHLGAVHFIARHVAPEMATRAQTIYSTLAFGVSLGVMFYLSGPLYRELAGSAFFVMAALALLSAFVAWKLRRRNLRLGLGQS